MGCIFYSGVGLIFYNGSGLIFDGGGGMFEKVFYSIVFMTVYDVLFVRYAICDCDGLIFFGACRRWYAPSFS